MNVFSRGIRNAFRNFIRAVSIIIILGLSAGLALTMLVAHQAVSNKITAVKSSIGNTVSISPAGFSNFSSANNALTTSQLSDVSTLPHVIALVETLTDRLSTIGSSSSFGFGSNSNNQTSLKSPIKLHSLGGRRFHISIFGGSRLPANFSPPITIIGTNNPRQLNAQSGNIAQLISGNFINGNTDTNNAMISTDMASENNLKVGSTFTAYGQTLTIAGIFDTGTLAGNNAIIVSLPTEQRLSGQSGEVTNAVATIDSLDNLGSATTAIKNILGSSADVTSSVDQANQVIQPLNSVKTVSLYSLVGAVIAGGVIIFLTMVMIVRERRREIGVIKAIGGSNLRIISQFIIESITLTILGVIIGVALGVIAGNPITKILVSSSSGSQFPHGVTRHQFITGGRGFGLIKNNISNIHTAVGWSILLYGLVAALIIAIIGSTVVSFYISKIQPAEVMRSE